MKRFRLIGYALVLAIGALAVHAQDMDVGQWTRFAYHIAAKGIYTPTSSTCVMNTMNVNISDAGTSWTLKVQTIQNEPRVLWSWATADGVGNFSQIKLPVGIVMTGGIRVVASGGTAGVADVEITGRCAPNPSATPFTTATPSSTVTPTSTPLNTPTPTPTPSATATPSATSSP